MPARLFEAVWMIEDESASSRRDRAISMGGYWWTWLSSGIAGRLTGARSVGELAVFGFVFTGASCEGCMGSAMSRLHLGMEFVTHFRGFAFLKLEERIAPA